MRVLHQRERLFAGRRPRTASNVLGAIVVWVVCGTALLTGCRDDGDRKAPAGGLDVCAETGVNAGNAIAGEGAIARCPPSVSEACPDERFCYDGNVYRCNLDGVGSTLAEECPPERPCHSSYRRHSYVDESQFGPGGADCLPPFEDVPCTPNSYRCLNSEIVARCNETGSSSDLASNCAGDGFRCFDGGCTVESDCSGGKTCRGNVLFDCIGYGLGATGVDCGEDAYCDNGRGQCRPKVCTPGGVSLFCASNRVERCNDWGSDWDISTMCWLGELCDDSSGEPQCTKLSCAPGSTACIANQVGTCGDDSSSLTAISTDCTAMGGVCDTAGGCSESVIDALGSDVASDSASFIGDVVCLDSTRKLTKLEAALTLVEPAELDWQVFKLIRGNITIYGYNDQIQDIADIELVGHVSRMYEAGTALFGSDLLDVLLEAGDCYVLAVQGPPSLPGAGQPVVQLVYYDDSPQPRRQLSFGQLMGGTRDPSRIDTMGSVIYHMRVTTELP